MYTVNINAANASILYIPIIFFVRQFRDNNELILDHETLINLCLSHTCQGCGDKFAYREEKQTWGYELLTYDFGIFDTGIGITDTTDNGCSYYSPDPSLLHAIEFSVFHVITFAY